MSHCAFAFEKLKEKKKGKKKKHNKVFAYKKAFNSHSLLIGNLQKPIFLCCC